MAKREKELMIEELASQLRQSSAILLAEFSNMPASKTNELRRVLKGHSTRYIVVKNSICRLALQRCNLEHISKLVNGPTCMSLVQGGDATKAAKILVDFLKGHDTFKLQGGYIGGKVFSLEEIRVLASLPSREVLVGHVVSSIKSPMVRLVLVLGDSLRRLSSVLEAVRKIKSGGESNG